MSANLGDVISSCGSTSSSGGKIKKGDVKKAVIVRPGTQLSVTMEVIFNLILTA